MFVATAVGPSLADLKPMKSPGSPVHPDLEARLLAHDPVADGAPDPVLAHALAVCSAYTYASVVGFGGTPDTLARIMARTGMASNRVLMVAERIDAAFVVASGFLVQSQDGGSAILAYRGTEPFTIANWLTDADLRSTPVAVRVGDEQFAVHPGFYRNVRAIRSPLVEALGLALEGRSIIDGEPVAEPLRALHLTGHSLGAAMAALTGLLLLEDPDYAPLAAVLRSCYGYGAPMVGSPGLARAAAAKGYADRFLRFVYRNDVVTGLPPRGLGGYAHFGAEYRTARDGGYRRVERSQGQSPFRSLLVAPAQFLAHRLPVVRQVPFRFSLDDHLPLNYVEWLAPAGGVIEYGGYASQYPS